MMTVAICTATNETYALGGAVALVSALTNAPVDALCRVYVLDGGIRDQSWAKLERSLAATGRRHELIRLRPEMASYTGLPQDWGASVMTYARLALPALVQEKRIFYVDADLVVQREWGELWEEGTKGKIVCAARDVVTETVGNERLNLTKFQMDGAAPYLQAGLLLIDLEAWREQRVSERVVEYLRENPEHCIYWDQSALNVVLYSRWHQWPDTWNTPAWWADQGKNGKTMEEAVLHFVGPHKPWLYGHHRSPSARRFFAWVDRTEWRGTRPSWVRQFAKQVKYRADSLLSKVQAR